MQSAATISRPLSVLFFAGDWPSDWHELSYLRPARSSRGAGISLLLVAWIAIVDFFWLRTNISILYVAPVLLLAWTGDLKLLRRTTPILLILTFAVFLLKNAIHPDLVDASNIGHRLFNRTLTAIMIIAMGRTVQSWIRWREDQSDPELLESERRQEQEISTTFAMLVCTPLVAVIALIDFLVPADYNLAILYPIPLFICGWTNNRRLLWAVFALLLILTAAAHIWGSPPSESISGYSLERNRIVAAIGMTVVAMILSRWMSRGEVDSA